MNDPVSATRGRRGAGLLIPLFSCPSTTSWGIGDIGELVVHMMTGKGYDERGPIGLGEPPTVGPMAAIANAVANAIGVRVPFMPITPDRVVAALKGGSNATV